MNREKWIVGVALLTLVAGARGGAIDWSRVPSKRLTLFYPGTSSWEWLLTDHPGAVGVRSGMACRNCHEGQESALGKARKEGEPAVSGQEAVRAAFNLQVQAVYDERAFYLRLRWPATAEAAPHGMRRVSVMLSSGKVHGVQSAGCWIACHDDEKGMPSAGSDSNATEYLPESREKMTDSGGNGYYRSPEALRALVAQKKYLEYWSVTLPEDGSPVADDGYVLEGSHRGNFSVLHAEAFRAAGFWTVTIRRPLKAGGVHLNIRPGQVYWVGFAVHDPGLQGRLHDVSLRYTLALDPHAGTDLVAVRRR